MNTNRSAKDIRADIDYLDFDSEGSMNHEDYKETRRCLKQELDVVLKTKTEK